MRHSGFTLIQLLMTIGIISILTSIFFPVFSVSRAEARRTTCLANLRQLVMTMNMYSQDWDDHLPAFGPGGMGPTWYDDPDNGLAGRGILVCPAKPEWNAADPVYQTGYGLNERIFLWWPGSGRSRLTPADFANPSQTIGGADRGPEDPCFLGPAFAGCEACPYNVATRHEGFANFFFMDGHVKALQRKVWALSDDAWSPAP